MRRMRGLLSAFAGAVSIASMARADDDIKTQQFHVKVETNYNFFDKTIHEASSAQGKALIGAVASYFGVPPSVVGIAAALLHQDQNGIEHHKFIDSPSGYTICYARPTGGQYNGVETTEDSTFNAVLVRPISGRVTQDGLAIYMAVPNRVSKRVRAESTFNVAFVKNPPGFGAHAQCRPTGEAAWLSRNANAKNPTGTRLNVPCPDPKLCP